MNNSITLSPQCLSKADSFYQTLKKTRPLTRADLKNYLKVFLGLDIGDIKICSEHNTPMDYLWHSYSSDFNGLRRAQSSRSVSGDCVVWAGRGGGKTLLAAAATLLDCIFKPNCKVRILAGSELQAQRMYDYLLEFLRKGFEGFLAEPVHKNKCSFINGSDVEVLTQSAASVRGSHIQKLRCDEIELFDRQILEAAKFVTKSIDGIVGAMESLSTMHQPFGIMHELVGKASACGTPIFKWCVWEVIENCPADRSCSRCPLNNDCRGRARKASGYLKIDDCIAQMRRSSRAAFESEMLCLRPSLENVVFAEFEPDSHIAPLDYNPALPLYRAIDFGFVNPFVCLWIQVDAQGTVKIIDEYVKSRQTIDVHADEIKNRTPYSEEQVLATFCDPAGAGVNDVTGTSPVFQLRQAGIKLRYKRSSILEGIELVRRSLRSGDGRSNLIISPRCGRLIEAMQCYHYPQAGAEELPLKDGIYDHPIDALRYFFVNYQASNPAKNRRY
ncbi:MAG: terminase family protein [Sedimentisphaerales bacterium]